MTIRCRSMQHEDIPECLEVLAGDSAHESRRVESLSLLGKAWARLLGRLAFHAVVVEEPVNETSRIVAVGTRVFISDVFLTEIKTPPFRWIGPEIVRRVLAGNSPVLSDRQVREANRNSGLNLFAWNSTQAPLDLPRHEIVSALFNTFAEQHRGFLLKELISQSLCAETLDGQLRSGGLLLDHQGQYMPGLFSRPEEIVRQPHIVGISRVLAVQQYGTWVSFLFRYAQPRFVLRPSEQRLLLHALNGLTDADLADQLGLSLSAVKKSWRRIYDRVGACDPELIPDTAPENGSHERGAMKKQRLLAYLREHPEELRPTQSP